MSRAASSFFPEWLDSRSDKSDFSPIPSHLLLLRVERCPAGYFKVHCSFSVGMRTVSKKDFNLKLWENDSYFLMKNIIVMFALCVLLLCIGFRGFFFFFFKTIRYYTFSNCWFHEFLHCTLTSVNAIPSHTVF